MATPADIRQFLVKNFNADLQDFVGVEKRAKSTVPNRIIVGDEEKGKACSYPALIEHVRKLTQQLEDSRAQINGVRELRKQDNRNILNPNWDAIETEVGFDRLSTVRWNGLPNGRFTSWTAGTSSAPDGWTLGGAGAAVAQATARPGAFADEFAMQLISGAGAAATLTRSDLKFQPGEIHNLTGFVMVNTNCTATVTISTDSATDVPQVLTLAASQIGALGWFHFPRNIGWQLVFTPNTDATTMTLELKVNSNNQIAKFSSFALGLGPMGDAPLAGPAPQDLNAINGDLTIPGDLSVTGDASVGGKLTVTGSIDPTDLTLDEQASVPGGTPSSGNGRLWAKTDQTLHYTDSSGTDSQVAPQTAASISAILVASASSARAVLVAGAGLTSPASSDFTALNSATLTDVTTWLGDGVSTNAPSTGSTGSNDMKGGHKSMSYSSGTITLIAGILGLVPQQQYPAYGVYFRESATGKIVTFNLYANAPSFYYAVFGGANFSGPSGATWVSNPTGSTDVNVIVPGNPVFFKLTYDGTHMRAYMSVDRANWLQCATVSKTEYFTTAPDQWGWFCNANTPSGDAYATCIDFSVS